MSTPRGDARQAHGFPARWAAIVVILCVADLILSASVVDAPLRMMAPPRAMRWALVAQECALLCVLAALPAIPRSRKWRIPLALLLGVTLTTCWFAFSTLGRFPGLDAIRFLLTVPVQAVQHVIQLDATIIPKTIAAIVAIVVLVELAVLACGPRASRGLRLMMLGLGLATLVGSTWFAARWGKRFSASRRDVYDANTGVTYRTDRLWRTLHEGNAGAASGLILSIWATTSNPSVVVPADPSIPVIEPARLPGQFAVKGVAAHHWNVLVIEVESLRSDVLTSWGGPREVMPHVDAIAATSRRFRNTYTTATQTDLASVVPLSGAYPLRDVTLRAYPRHIPYPRVLLYDVLAPAGWRAGVFSSQNEDWWGMANFLRSRSLDTLFHAETFAGATYTPTNDIGFAKFVRDAKRSGKIDDYDTVTEALKWLSVRRDQPFFLYINLQTSHLPYEVPARVPRRFGSGPPSFPILFGRYPRDSAEVVHDEYRNALAYVDDQIARVEQALRADRRWDSTIVVITGDHGQAFFEHENAGHANGIEQELVQVPLMIRAPGLATGNDSQPASHIDVAPTVVSLLGLPQQPAWQGTPLTTERLPADRPRFFMVQSPLAHRIGMVSGPWKIVRDVREGGTRLFNLTDDATTVRDRSTSDPAVAKRLLAVLDSWRAVQLGYYSSTIKPATHFPPRLAPHSPLLP